MSCFAASTVPVNEVKIGQPYVCRPCRRRNPALSTALPPPATTNPTPVPAPPRTIVVHDASPPPKRDVTSLGHGQPPVSQASHSNPRIHVAPPPPPPPPPLPPPQGRFVPMPIAPDAGNGTSNFDAIMRFVHPDHRHILGYRGVLVPPPPSQMAPTRALASGPTVVPTPPAAPEEPGPAVKRIRLTVPHYSRTGEILAVLPEDVGLERASRSPAKASNVPLTSVSTVRTNNVAESRSLPLAQSELHPLETPRKVSVTHTQDGSVSNRHVRGSVVQGTRLNHLHRKIKLKIPPKHTSPPTAPVPALAPSVCLSSFKFLWPATYITHAYRTNHLLGRMRITLTRLLRLRPAPPRLNPRSGNAHQSLPPAYASRRGARTRSRPGSRARDASSAGSRGGALYFASDLTGSASS